MSHVQIDRDEIERFLDNVVADTGLFVYLFDGNKENSIWQRAAKTKQDLVEQQLRLSSEQKNTWFALGTAKTFMKKGLRARSNINHLKAVWHDIDVGKIGAYATRDEAYMALYHMVEADKVLPPTYVVDSGYGLHVYWCFDEALTPEEWMHHAAQTNKALQGDPLLCVDMTRIVDVSSILRMPGTANWKDKDNGKLVAILSEQDYCYEPEDFDDFYGRDGLAPYMPRERRMDLGNQMSWLGPPPFAGSRPQPLGTLSQFDLPYKADPASLLKACAQVRHFATNQSEQTYDMWFQLVGIAKGTTLGEKFAHIISKDYPTYDPDEVDNKYNEWRGGWPSCATVRAYSPNPSLCEGCPFETVQKQGPLHLARQLVETQTPDDADDTESETSASDDIQRLGYIKPPAPYTYTATATAVRHVDPDSGATYLKQCVQGRLLVQGLTRSEHSKVSSVKLRLQHSEQGDADTDCDVEVPLGVIVSSKQETLKMLGNAGINVISGHAGDVMSMIQATVDKYLKEQQGRQTRTYEQAGWKHKSDTDQHTSFVLPDRIILEDGSESEVLTNTDMSAQMGNHVKARGSVKTWAEVIQPFMCDTRYDILTFGLLLGFASPLMTFSSAKRAVVSFAGMSGAGKTTALVLCNTVFGKPSADVIKVQDTTKSRYKVISVYGNLAVAFDETTKASSEDMENLLFTVAGGSEGSALNRDQSFKTNHKTWELIVASSTNLSIVDTADQRLLGGQIARLWELKTYGSAMPESVGNRIVDMYGVLGANHGVAGPKFISHVIQNKDAITKRIAEVELQFKEAKYALANQRFVISAMATTYVAAEIINKLGILRIDMSWIIDRLDKRKPTQDQHDAITSEHRNNATILLMLDNMADVTAVLDGTRLVSRPVKGNETPSVVVEVGPDLPDAKVYIRRSKYKEYCRQNKIGGDSLLQDLVNRGLADPRDARKNFSAGVSSGRERYRAICFHVGRLDPTRYGDYIGAPEATKDNVVNIKRTR